MVDGRQSGFPATFFESQSLIFLDHRPMSPKKYLSLDEAAQQLGLRNDELNRLRERGEVRGFADRGTWKFKVEDIEELARSRQADSDPEVPMFMDDLPESEEELELPVWGTPENELAIDDESVMVLDDDDTSDDPTVIRKSVDPLNSSDSDVRLVFDEPMIIKASEPEPTIPSDSDSDVRLVGNLVPELDSDSDVKLVNDLDSDSDVKLVGDDTINDIHLSLGEPPQMGSDSDVRLVSAGTESDISLTLGEPPKLGSDSEIRVKPPQFDEDEIAAAIGDAPDLGSDSEIRLGLPDDDDEEAILIGEPLHMDSDSDVHADLPDDEEFAVSLDGPPEWSSDSDIRLSPPESDSDIKLVGEMVDSDSDIKLVAPESTSDSDVKLLSPELESDSDIQLVGADLGTERDVPLISADLGGDSDVKLVNNLQNSDSDVQLLGPADSSIALDFESDDGESASVLSEESGIALGSDSAMMLATESGFSLGDPNDSGIALSADSDEGITLDTGSQDSGISLSTGDSGISLSMGDSGISLEAVADSGISFEDSAEFGGTIPMMAVPTDDNVPETKFEIPSMKDDSAFELRLKGDDNASTQVLNLNDSGEATIDDAVFDVDDDDADLDLQSEDDLEVSDDAFADDDEDLEDMEVFGADDDAFADEDGGSPRPMRGGMAVGYEPEWSMGTVATLGFSTVILSLCMFLMFDLVKTMWVSQPGTPVASALLESLGGMFK